MSRLVYIAELVLLTTCLYWVGKYVIKQWRDRV